MRIKNSFLLQILLLAVFFVSYIGIIARYGLPLYPLTVLIYLITYLILRSKIYFSQHFIPFTVLLVIFLIHFWLTGFTYTITRGEFINGISIFLILLTFQGLFNSKRAFDKFIDRLQDGIIYISVFVSSLGLYKFSQFIFNRKTISFFSGDISASNTALINDYNFFAAGLLVSLIFLNNKINNQKRILPQQIIYIVLITVAIIFSGSRRGIAVLGALFIYYLYKIFKNFSSHLRDIFSRAKLKKHSFKLLVMIAAVVILGGYAASKTNVASLITKESAMSLINKNFERLATVTSAATDFGESTRGVLWEKSAEIMNSGNVLQSIFGHGFKYIQTMGHMFNNTEQYPHSQILAQLLFSGIVGFFILLLVYLHLMLIGIKHFSNYKDILLAFVVIFLFAQFSGDTFLYYKTNLMFYIIIVHIPIYNRLPKLSQVA